MTCMPVFVVIFPVGYPEAGKWIWAWTKLW